MISIRTFAFGFASLCVASLSFALAFQGEGLAALLALFGLLGFVVPMVVCFKEDKKQARRQRIRNRS